MMMTASWNCAVWNDQFPAKGDRGAEGVAGRAVHSAPSVKVTVHTRHSQNRAFSAFRCFAALFAHEMALPSHIHAGRFSCEHEICPQEYACEL